MECNGYYDKDLDIIYIKDDSALLHESFHRALFKNEELRKQLLPLLRVLYKAGERFKNMRWLYSHLSSYPPIERDEELGAYCVSFIPLLKSISLLGLNEASIRVMTVDNDPMMYSCVFAGIESEIADMESLLLAEDMNNKSLSKEHILELTGWFQGLDDFWRFEIDDFNSSVNKTVTVYELGSEIRAIKGFKGSVSQYMNQNPESDLTRQYLKAKKENQTGVPLVDCIKHPSLFESYPHLKDYFVLEYLMDKNTLGHLDKMTIHINSEKLKTKSILMHEVQHIIQETEGFSLGGNKDIAWDLLRKKHEGYAKSLPSYKNASNKIDFIDDLINIREPGFTKSDTAMQAYLSLAGEIEARVIEERSENNNTNIFKLLDYQKEDVLLTFKEKESDLNLIFN